METRRGYKTQKGEKTEYNTIKRGGKSTANINNNQNF